MKLTALDRTRATNLFFLALVKQRVEIVFDHAIKKPHRRVPAELKPLAQLGAEARRLIDAQFSQADARKMLEANVTLNAMRDKAKTSTRYRLPTGEPTAQNLADAARARYGNFSWNLGSYKFLENSPLVAEKLKVARNYLPYLHVQKEANCFKDGTPLVNFEADYLMPFTGGWSQFDITLSNPVAYEMLGSNQNTHLNDYLEEGPRQLAQAFREEAFRVPTFQDLTKVWPGLQPHESVVCWRKDRPGPLSTNLPSAFSEQTRAALRSLAGTLEIAA